MAPSATDTEWDHQFHTLRRENLFRNPPKDHTAYPALQLAVDPHLESFNGLFRDDGKPGLLAHGIADIGARTYLDGDDRASPDGKNRLTIRYKDVFLQKPQVPPSNKTARNRQVFPAECRERHVTYRGRLSATLEYRINGGDPVEFTREFGQVPVMIKVCIPIPAFGGFLLTYSSRTDATLRTTRLRSLSRERKNPRSLEDTLS